MVTLETPIAESRLPSLTPAVLRRLREGLRIETVRDLLWHLPIRYEKRGAAVAIAQLSDGAAATITATVERVRVGRTMRKKISFTEATVADPSGRLSVLWFHQPWMAERLRVGDRIMLSGRVSQSGGRRYLANPQYEILNRAGVQPPTRPSAELRPHDTERSASRLVAIYPETEGITSRWLSYLVGETLKRIGSIPDELPTPVQTARGLPPLSQCIRQAHFPKTRAEAERAKRELLLRELFALQCAILLARARRESHRAITVPFDAHLVKTLLATLPFSITEAQRIAAYEILRDLEKPRPMRRLLVGDVGSGKTIVAAIAALAVIKNAKGQAALMAPTEILAKQHFDTLANIISPHNVRVGLLTGHDSRVTPKRIASEKSIRISKPKLYHELAQGDIHLLVGTHALISDPRKGRPTTLKPQGALRFKKLLLAIIDEQHRFGVAQRKRMEDTERAFSDGEKTGPISPHLLSMTATPIPRTLALTIFGDLDISTLRELPKGRRPIATAILSPSQEEIAFEKIRQEAKAGHQSFFICPLISKSEKIQAKAATEEFERLKKDVFPDLRLGLMHGQLKSEEKERVMRDFAKGRIDLLVATPVVEVGIDIPNATVMVIEGAERFGLAQLYQFRGRVGRSDLPSFCFLIAGTSGRTIRRRLAAIAKSGSGEDIAAEDLAIRGPGQLVGEEQSGLADAAMSALRDLPLIEEARRLARDFLSAHSLRSEPALARRVADIRRRLHLS